MTRQGSPFRRIVEGSEPDGGRGQMDGYQHVPVVLVHLLEPLEDAQLLWGLLVALVGQRAGLPQVVGAGGGELPCRRGRHLKHGQTRR